MCARPANPELRKKILDAALKIVEDCGSDCVTMREVAEEVGYTPTTLYLYFEDKNAILKELIVCGFEDLAEFCAQAQVGPTPLDKLRQRGRAYITWGLLHPSYYRLMVETRIVSGLTEEQTNRLVPAIRQGVDIIEDAIEAGQLIGIDDAAEFGNLTWAALHGVTTLAISRRLVPAGEKASAPELLESATTAGDTLLEALLAQHLPKSLAEVRAERRPARQAKRAEKRTARAE
jgi:AcrR family transcriptional regulator